MASTDDGGSGENGTRRSAQSSTEEHITQGETIRKPIPPPYVPENDPLSMPRQQAYRTEVVVYNLRTQN